MRSATAHPSLRNSGLLTTSNSTPALLYRRIVSATFSPGFDRNGALVDDYAIFLEYLGDLARNFLDVGEVHASIGLRWSRHRNENNLGMIDAICDAVRKPQSAGRNVAMNDFFQTRVRRSEYARSAGCRPFFGRCLRRRHYGRHPRSKHQLQDLHILSQ